MQDNIKIFLRSGPVQSLVMIKSVKSNSVFKIFITIILLLVALLICRNYYLKEIKYADLEKHLKQIHIDLNKNFTEKDLNQHNHVGVGMAIRHKYNIWSETSELRVEFAKVGINHPDDISSILLETYARAQQNIPFESHKLINLLKGTYSAENLQEHLKKVAKEFRIYQLQSDDFQK